MSIGEFGKKPPPGPQIGPTKKYDELDADQKDNLGGLDKLKAPITASSSPPVEKQLESEGIAQAEEGAEKLEALQAVLQPAEEEDPDDARLAAASMPTDQDRREFMRCLLGNRAYEKRYELFGGMIVIVFRDIPPDEEDKLFALLAQQQSAEKIKTDEDWSVVLDRLRLVANVKSMIVSGQPEITNPPSIAACTEAEHVRAMSAFKSSTTYRAALMTLRSFKLHLEWMVEKALDSDFWEVDGLGSQPEPTSDEPSTTDIDQS